MAKVKEELDPLWGQVPELEVDGVKLYQSSAIGRFLARKFGLAGKTEIEQAQVDSAVDAFMDYYRACRPFWGLIAGYDKGDKDAIYKEHVVPASEKLFRGMNRMLKESGSGFLVGKSLTWADLVLSDFIATIQSYAPQLYDGHPEIKKYVDGIRSRPNIKKWIEKRPTNVIW